MSNEIFQLTTVTRLLAGDVELAEALGFPEVSALDEAERKWRPALLSKTRALLADNASCPALWLHRRRGFDNVALRETEITLEPPRRTPEWQEPVRMRVPLVTWEEEGLHHAFVPGLAVHVFATRPSLIDDRVEQHIRLVLAGGRKHLSLVQIAKLSRVQSVRLGRLDVSVQLKTPRQIAAFVDGQKDKPSVLAKIAEELPPLTAAAVAAGDSGQPSKAPGAERHGAAPVAYEMESELALLAEALSGPHRRSVLLVGRAGCGKTALFQELARRRRDFGFGQTPFWCTTGARLMSGQIGFGMWQERCQQMCQELGKSNAILHLGNLGELLEVGKTSRGEQSVGGFLRVWIARGEILTIAECTPEQFGAIERIEPHLLGVFHSITLPERTPEQTRSIFSRVFDAAPGTTTGSSQDPGTAPDRGCGAEPSRSKPTASGAPRHSHDAAADPRHSRDPVHALALDRLHQLHQRYATYSANPGRPLRFLKNLLADRFPDKSLSETDVTAAFSRETGLPVVLLDDRVPLDLERTADWFAGRVIGQPAAAGGVLDLLARIKARLARPRKPLASLLFIGPTGTGKTEMAKALAEFLFGDASRLVRFDLNEFGDALSVQRLIGGPARGEAEGLLTARVREQPFSVVLLDEFEKADPSFFDLLLQILGDGRLTDASGRVADFCNCVIVMTSNLGAQDFQRGPAGFRSADAAIPDTQVHFTAAVRNFLRPEIFNRLDAVVPFQALSPEIVLAIARRQLVLIQQRDGIRLRPLEWELLPEVADHLALRGYDARYGARPLKRAIERELLVPLAEALNNYDRDTPLTVTVGAAEGRVQVRVRGRPTALEPSSATRPGPTHISEQSRELAERITGLRRLIHRLQNCAATSALENQVTILESLERRIAKAGVNNPALRKRLAVLPKFRDCIRAIAALATRAQDLETEALSTLYRREVLESALFAPEAHTLDMERERLSREVFRLGLDDPNDVLLAFYSEHRETLLEFAGTFRAVAAEMGDVVALDYFLHPPEGRSTRLRFLRKTAERIPEFFAAPPEKLIGIAMHLRGDLFLPRFQRETGLHIVKEKGAEKACLIESAMLPLEKYEPPAGIERSGGIKARDASMCRIFDRGQKTINDCQRGERPWEVPSLGHALAELLDERLHALIAASTGQ